MNISCQLMPAPLELLLCIRAKASSSNAKSIYYQKKRIYIISLVFLVLQIKVFGQPTEVEKYHGEDPPHRIPKEFTPKIISQKNMYIFGSIFSKKADKLDGNGSGDLYSCYKNADQPWTRAIWGVESIRENENSIPLSLGMGNPSFL